MAFVPGGQPLRPAERARAPLANLGQALRDHNFSYFLAGMGCYSVGAYMLASFLPLYLKEKIGLESSTVVALDMAVMFGSAFGSVLAGMLADRLGSRPVMMPGLALSVLIPAGWLLMGPGVPQVIVWSGLLYFAYGAVSSIASIGAIRLLFNAVIPVEKNTEYTAIYYAWAGFSGGITPLAAGWLLQFLAAWQVNFGSWALGAFQLLFLLSLLGFAASTYFYGKVKPDGRYSTRTAIRQLFKKGKETVIHLWQTDIPHFRADFSADIPAIEPYLLPGDAPRPVVIVLPGGGYNHRAAHEGEPIARWLNEIGLSAFVLTYRVAPYRHPVPLLDVQRAIRTVRCRASEFGVDAQRIGVLGFSAGGHLTSTAGTHFDAGDPTAADPVERVSSRPDALVLCYPVISFGEYRHQGSCTTLLGENPPQEMIDLLSNEKQVTPQTPPTFLWHTANDGGVPVENSLLFAAALSRHKVPFDLHIFADGPHGVGLALDRPALAAWTQLCAAWFKELGWI
jgi:acetyl esterase/lipase